MPLFPLTSNFSPQTEIWVKFQNQRILKLIHSSANRGFTFLEIMVALAIIAIVLVTVYQLQSQSLSAEYISRFHVNAPLLARQKISEIESLPLNEVNDDSGGFGKQFPGYTWQVTTESVISELLEDEADNLRKIEVTVFLNEDENEFKIRTYRYFQK